MQSSSSKFLTNFTTHYSRKPAFLKTRSWLALRVLVFSGVLFVCLVGAVRIARAAGTPPVANDDPTIVTDEDTAVTISPLVNDSDVDDEPLHIDSLSEPSNGTAVISVTQVIYTPNPNFNGVDAFLYVVSDGFLTDTATITVAVAPVNDAPQVIEHRLALLDTWGTNGGNLGYGNGDGEFQRPDGIAIDSLDNIYVADSRNRRIQKFDSNGTFVAKWGRRGIENGEFSLPTRVAVDGSGNVYVLNHSLWAHIQKFDSNGRFMTTWDSFGPDDGHFMYPSGIAVDGSATVYIVDTRNHLVQKLDSNGNFVTKWGSQGQDDGEFTSPTGIAVDSVGNVYVADPKNYRIQKFDSNGNFLTKWGGPGSGDGVLRTTDGLAVDNNDNVYIADLRQRQVQKFDSNGNFLTKWGGPGSGDGEFENPTGIALDSSGNVYVVDVYNLIACRSLIAAGVL